MQLPFSWIFIFVFVIFFIVFIRNRCFLIVFYPFAGLLCLFYCLILSLYVNHLYFTLLSIGVHRVICCCAGYSPSSSIDSYKSSSLFFSAPSGLIGPSHAPSGLCKRLRTCLLTPPLVRGSPGLRTSLRAPPLVWAYARAHARATRHTLIPVGACIRRLTHSCVLEYAVTSVSTRKVRTPTSCPPGLLLLSFSCSPAPGSPGQFGRTILLRKYALEKTLR